MMKVKAINHKRLQHYEHHYGMVCLTGLLGCRWHRYQQSQDPSSKCDIGWYIVMLVTSLFTLFWLYFWILAENSADHLNMFVYRSFGAWTPFHYIIFILTCITISYLALLNILALCHLGHHHQVHLHWTHKVALVVVLVLCVVCSVVVTELWHVVWSLQAESLMITAPFLHLSAVVVMTMASWLISGYWFSLYRTVSRVLWLGFYITVMLFLYLVPLLIHSPCITEKSDLPRKPHLVGHRGAPEIRPENTAYSFETSSDSVITFESDVRVSFEGVPYLLHDASLRRTTDVTVHWPEYTSVSSCWFNITQLQSLDAGSWYLKTDPFRAVSSLTPEQRSHCVNQTIPRLSWLLETAKMTNKNIMFDLLYDSGHCHGHPYEHTYLDVVMETIQESGINMKQIWWLLYTYNLTHSAQENMTRVFSFESCTQAPSVEELRQHNIDRVNAKFGCLSWKTIRSYQEGGIPVTLYIVDSAWLFSLYWCMGVDSVTSDRPIYLSTVDSPVWLLTPRQFKAMWITTDVVSVAIVILFFVVQHLRKTGKTISKTINTEKISLQGAKIRMSHMRKSRNMREKLLHTVEGLQEVSPGMMGISSENIAMDTDQEVGPSTATCERGAVAMPSADRGATFVDPVTCTAERPPGLSDRFSTASGWSAMSGISGISAISGTGVGDSSFTTTEDSSHHGNGSVPDVKMEVAA